MNKYLVDDGNWEMGIEADSPEEAAQEYVESGDFSDGTETVWVEVSVTDEAGDITRHTITIEPDEPECEKDHDHDWVSDWELVGGCKENPGVWGHSGGVIIREVCRHCGAHRITDTWAQNMANGEQGLRSVRYEVGDEICFG